MTKLPRITVYIVLTAVLGTSYNKPCFAIDTSGFQYWSTADFHVDLDKDWTAIFQEEFRLGDDGGCFPSAEMAQVNPGRDNVHALGTKFIFLF